jgi:hypothetical protein
VAISSLAVTTGQTVQDRGFGELKVGQTQMGLGFLRLCGECSFYFMTCGLRATKP